LYLGNAADEDWSTTLLALDAFRVAISSSEGSPPASPDFNKWVEGLNPENLPFGKALEDLQVQMFVHATQVWEQLIKEVASSDALSFQLEKQESANAFFSDTSKRTTDYGDGVKALLWKDGVTDYRKNAVRSTIFAFIRKVFSTAADELLESKFMGSSFGEFFNARTPWKGDNNEPEKRFKFRYAHMLYGDIVRMCETKDDTTSAAIMELMSKMLPLSSKTFKERGTFVWNIYGKLQELVLLQDVWWPETDSTTSAKLVLTTVQTLLGRYFTVTSQGAIWKVFGKDSFPKMLDAVDSTKLMVNAVTTE
jgi:hypothetical protein